MKTNRKTNIQVDKNGSNITNQKHRSSNEVETGREND